MSSGPMESLEQSPFCIRAERALQALRQHVVAHLDRESRVRHSYGELHETWLFRSEQLRRQISELEARLAPWMPRDDSPRLAVVSRIEESN